MFGLLSATSAEHSRRSENPESSCNHCLQPNTAACHYLVDSASSIEMEGMNLSQRCEFINEKFNCKVTPNVLNSFYSKIERFAEKVASSSKPDLKQIEG